MGVGANEVQNFTGFNVPWRLFINIMNNQKGFIITVLLLRPPFSLLLSGWISCVSYTKPVSCQSIVKSMISQGGLLTIISTITLSISIMDNAAWTMDQVIQALLGMTNYISHNIKYHIGMLYNMSPTRNKSHKINKYKTVFSLLSMSKSTHFICPTQDITHVCIPSEIQSCQFVSNDLWLSSGVLILSLNKTIDWSNVKIWEMWNEKKNWPPWLLTVSLPWARGELTVNSWWPKWSQPAVTEPWPGPWLSCDIAVTEPWLSCDLAVTELWPSRDWAVTSPSRDWAVIIGPWSRDHCGHRKLTVSSLWSHRDHLFSHGNIQRYALTSVSKFHMPLKYISSAC